MGPGRIWVWGRRPYIRMPAEGKENEGWNLLCRLGTMVRLGPFYSDRRSGSGKSSLHRMDLPRSCEKQRDCAVTIG